MTGSAFTLRPAGAEDEQRLYDWRRDPFILNLSLSRHVPDTADHARWFRKALEGEIRRIFIVYLNGEAAGQVRFERESRAARTGTISAFLLERFTGRGVGVLAIAEGCVRIARDWGLETVEARIRAGNENSERAFAKAGFHRVDSGQKSDGSGHSTMQWKAPK